MNAMTPTRGRNIRATVAVVLAAGLVGVLALALMSAGGTADSEDRAFNAPGARQGEGFPRDHDKFAPGRIIDTAAPNAQLQATALSRCLGEGLMDSANYAALEDAVGSVADYCSSGARYAGEPETAPRGYPAPICHDGLLNTEIYGHLTKDDTFLAEECASRARPAGGPDAEAGPGEGSAPACRDGRLVPEAYANLSEEAIYFLSLYCASNDDPAGEQDGTTLVPTGEGWLTSGKPD